MREYVKPRIRLQIRGLWVCFVPGQRSFAGSGKTPTDAYACWLSKQNMYSLEPRYCVAGHYSNGLRSYGPTPMS